MQNKIFKTSIFISALVLILLGISTFAGPRGGDDAADVGVQNFEPLHNEEMQIHFLDVGQGDAIYIRLPDERDILIDGGPDKNVLAELGEVMPFWDREIDVMVLSHPHSDHVTWPIHRS